MALLTRPRLAVPQCAACLRSYAFPPHHNAVGSALGQQIRGRKRMANNSGTIIVRLRKDTEGYGRQGSLVPISPGAMRNKWLPAKIAEYVTMPELKTLKQNDVPMERDYSFLPKGMKKRRTKRDPNASAGINPAPMSVPAPSAEPIPAERPEPAIPVRAPEVEKLSPARSVELIEEFLPPRLDFYRQPIVEVKPPEKPKSKAETPTFGGAAGDLMAARLKQKEAEQTKPKPQAIYGSVSTQDVLVAIRAAIANDTDAAKVVLQDSDLTFVELPEFEGSESDSGRIKHIGDYFVEVRVPRADQAVRRVVRVIPQEAGGNFAEPTET